MNIRYLKLTLPRHTTYVETRGSRGALLFHKPRSGVEVLNDSDGAAIGLSRVVLGPATRAAFASQYAALTGSPSTSVVSDAVTDALHFARELEVATTPVPGRRYVPPRGLGLVSGLDRLDRVFDRLRRVQLEDKPTDDLIRRYDWSGTLFVCDERGTEWEGAIGCAITDAMRSAVGKIILITDRPPVALPLVRWRRCPMGTGETVIFNY
jgi:hypothetical protein